MPTITSRYKMARAKALRAHIKRYHHWYEMHGEVVKITVDYNLISQPVWAVATFEDGFVKYFFCREDGTFFGVRGFNRLGRALV